MESMVIPENEQDLSFQVNQYCRFCLCKPDKLVPLKCRVKTTPVPEMFTYLTGIEIDFEDPYPKKVCTVCIGKLNSAYAIRKEFLANYATLQSLQSDVVEIKEEYLEEEHLEMLKECQGDELAEGSTKYQVALSNVQTVVAEPIKLEIALEPEEDSSSEYEDVDDAVEYPSSSDEGQDGEAEFKPRKKYKMRRDPSVPLVRKRKHNFEGEPSKMDPNKCYICQLQFENPRELNVHLPIHSDMLPYSCEACAEGRAKTDPIITVLMLHRHIRMHAGTIGCPYCPYRVFTVNTLKGHIEREHSERAMGTFNCEKCGYILNSKRLFTDHMKRHEAVEQGKYTCQICNCKFGNGPRLKRHMLTHEEKKYQCQYCAKYLRSNTLLLTHEREHADNGGAQYACEFCKLLFVSHVERAYHLTTKHPEYERKNTQMSRTVWNPSVNGGMRRKIPKDLKCQVEGCDHQAKSLPGYYNHRYKHSSKYECPYCSKRCTNKAEYNVHVNTHTGDKPFECDICDKKFNQKPNLVNHRRLHTGERPYLCTDCGQTFESNKKLANHILQHSAPQHKCIPCNKEFRYKGDYTKHMKVKHAEPSQDLMGTSQDLMGASQDY
uniref:C2h2-type zn-finger protein n=1 Tax=Culex tarsalis TaxID=7177 RepID=A0A1Q3F7N5_CULTA